MALGADYVQAAGDDDALMLFVANRLGFGERGVVCLLVHLGRVEALAVEDLRGQSGGVAAELDVGATAGHVRGDGDGTDPPGLGHDRRFLLVELGVENLVLDPAPLEHVGQMLGLLHRHGADQDRPSGVVHLDDLVDQGQVLAGLVAKDEVRLVVADHRLVSRHGHDFELVDLVQLFGLGHSRAGHARELGVEPEVVLEGDRGQGHALALNVHAFLGFDRLMKTLAPAAAGHLATGELVDDDDLAVLDDVVAVALVEGVRPQGRLEVASQRRVVVVEVLDAEELLHLGDAFLGRRNGLVLEIDEVVAALFVALRPADQARHEPGEEGILVGGLLGLAADDERRAGFVDEDVVDLVDDGEEALALDPLLHLRDHVVTQVVEPELVVGTVGDVGGVGLASRARPQVDQPLVVRGVARLEHVRRVVGDDPDREAQEVVDGPHPLGVAAGQVVVDGDEVDAPAGQAVQRCGQRRDQRLAFARPHLGDAALVQDDAADQLDVEVAHLEGPPHRLAGRREDLR